MRIRTAAAASGLVLLVGGVVGSVATPALAVRICDGSSSCAQEYNNWGGVYAQDTACDNTGVYAEYRRTQSSTTTQTINNYTGCNTQVGSGSDTVNYVYKMRAATNWWGPDSYSDWVWR